MRSRLAAYWFAYMAGFGIFFPFYTLYLRQDLGLTESRVGLVVAVIPLVGLIAQPAWGRVADATGSRRHVMAVLALGVALASVGLGLAGGFWPILLATALFALFSTSAMPMATSVTLAAEAHRGGAAVFGPIRAIGTLGFLIAVQLFPFLLDALETLDRPFRDLGWMFPTIAACTLPAALVALSLRDVGEMTLRSHRGDLGRLWRHPPFVRLLVFLFAAHLCMQGPIRLFPLLVDARGGGVTTLSSMWLRMLALEIPLLALAGVTLHQLGARGLIFVGLLAEGARWTLSAATDDMATLTAAQLLHGVGVAGVIVGGPLYLEQAAPRRLRSSGQALVSAVGFGLASIASVAALGWAIEHFGVSAPYGLAGGGCLLLAVLVWVALPPPYRPAEPSGADSLSS